MSKNAAGEELLGELHMTTARVILAGLDGEPIFNDEGVEVGRRVDPRIISTAVTFLNNNKVIMTPWLDEKMTEIQERLQNRKTRFKVVDPLAMARKAAANE
jgi:hypothetical protein